MSNQEKSLELASVQVGLGFPDVAKQMGRLSGPCGRSARRDALVAADADTSSVSDKDNEARVVYGKAEKQSGVKRKAERAPRRNKDKIRGDSQTLNGSNRRTGARNR